VGALYTKVKEGSDQQVQIKNLSEEGKDIGGK